MSVHFPVEIQTAHNSYFGPFLVQNHLAYVCLMSHLNSHSLPPVWVSICDVVRALYLGCAFRRVAYAIMT